MSGTEWTTLDITCDDGVATVLLDRPERLNALSAAMFDELPRALYELDADPALRVIVITGSGRGFCAGMDLSDVSALPTRGTPELIRAQEGWGQATLALREISLPVIAAVNGPAAGAGFSMALAADIRIASTAARFNAAFIKVGLTGGDVGSSWLLPRIVGLGQAYEALLTGRFIDATEALRIGLVNRVVEPDELLQAATALAREIAANSPTAVRLTKQVVQTNVDAPSLRAAMALENRNQVLAMTTDDMVEAVDAFLAKRPPRFRTPERTTEQPPYPAPHTEQIGGAS